MNKSDKGIFLITRSPERYVLICTDSVVLIASLWLSFSLRLQDWYWPVGGMTNPIVFLVLCAPIIAVPVFFYFGFYRRTDHQLTSKTCWSIVQAVLVYAALWGLLAVLSGTNGVPRSVVLINFWMSLIAMGASRTLAYWAMCTVEPSVPKKYASDNSDIDLLGKLVVMQSKFVRFIFKDTFIQSVILYFGIVFIYKAIPIAVSDTGMYSADHSHVILTLIASFIISVLSVSIVYKFLNKKWKSIATILSTFAALTGLFYAFIYPYEVGQLDALTFPTFSTEKEIGPMGLALILLLMLWFFLFEKIKQITWILLISINLGLMTQATVAGFNSKTVDILIHDFSKEMTPREAENFYSFSREKNTIVIMMDMFQGNMFADIISKYPELGEQLTGFTYYPNTLSHGSQTWKSMGAVAGGEKFQAQYMGSVNSYKHLTEISEQAKYLPRDVAYLNNMEMARRYEHTYAIFNPSYVDCSIFNTYADAICAKEVMLDKNTLNKGYALKSKPDAYFRKVVDTSKFFATLSLTLSFPHELKEYGAKLVADNSFGQGEEKLVDEYLDNIFHYSQMQNLVNFSNADSGKKTFKFIENKYTHGLWMTNEHCEVVIQNFQGYEGHFNTGYCATKLLGDFFKKLKELGIYQKTKIIIVSDHGYIKHSKLKTEGFGVPDPRASALLLVKDFNQTGNLKVSMEFMSNMDAYGIALSGVSEGLEIKEDKIKTPINNRSLIYISETAPANSYNISKAFRVERSIFDEENWIELNSSQIKQLEEQSLELRPID